MDTRQQKNESVSSDEWFTPKWVIDLLGPFDLDPCSPVIRPYDTAKVHYNSTDNGLSQEWSGRVWLNPPYSRVLLEQFVKKMAGHGNGIALLVNRQDNVLWQEVIFPTASSMIFMRHRVKFLRPDGTFKLAILNTMQTPALFALKNQLVEGEAHAAMTARLRQNFKDHDGCLQTGFLGTSILMQTLTENGMQDIAYDLLFQRKNPSWLYSVDNGATTIWERWNSYMVEKGMGPRGMNSFNHYAYGCVCQWLWETAAGIAADPAQPGFKHIIMKPVPDKRLGHLSAEYQSAAGLIKSAWQYEGDKCTWTFTIPEGATATVTLPGQTEAKDYESGTYTLTL